MRVLKGLAWVVLLGGAVMLIGGTFIEWWLDR